jgi:adenylate cyclase
LYPVGVNELSRLETARRAGVGVEDLDLMVDLGLLFPDADHRFAVSDVRKAGFLSSLRSGGLPLDAVAVEMKKGHLSLDFLDDPVFEHFSALSPLTFKELSKRTGVPVESLMVIREAIGSAVPESTDRVRETELAIVPLIEAQLASGYPREVIERSLRTLGDNLRTFVEAEADDFRAYVIDPVDDRPGEEISAAAAAAAARMAGPTDQAILAVHRAQQVHAWTANIIGGFEHDLARAGLLVRVETPPAMCFLDLTGYTRLTAEHGDRAAAELADRLRRLVQRTSVHHGGRPVKWLGDGVMFWFRDPGRGVVAALEMADSVVAAGMPPAHVGLDAGAVLFQDGDYYGQTVNTASRIAEYARPGEVLVSQAVVDASAGAPIEFTEIGPVELKGVTGVVRLHVARTG